MNNQSAYRSLSIPFNQRIIHAVELTQGDLILLLSGSTNIPSGVTIPTSTGSGGVIHPTPFVATGVNTYQWC